MVEVISLIAIAKECSDQLTVVYFSSEATTESYGRTTSFRGSRNQRFGQAVTPDSMKKGRVHKPSSTGDHSIDGLQAGHIGMLPACRVQ